MEKLEKKHKLALAKGILFVILWYFCIWSAFLFICCPIWIFILIFPKVFEPIVAVAFSIWETYSVALMNIIFGSKIHVSGDEINGEETSILIVNHRTRVDWNFLWALMYYASIPRCHKMKIALKAELRHMPSLGWAMQTANCLYLTRKWEKDQDTMRRQLKFFSSAGHKYQILLFPEGTDLSEESLQKSNEFAKKNNLNLYNYVLHPRTTGFVFLVDSMRKEKIKLEAVYDLTLAYPDFLPHTEMDIVKGNFPKIINFHVTRYSVQDLPQDKENLETWLKERWREKEQLLEKFEKHKSFPGPLVTSHMENQLYLSFMVGTGLIIYMFYLLFTSTVFFWWTILHICLYVGISYFTPGFQILFVSAYEYLYDRKKYQ